MLNARPLHHSPDQAEPVRSARTIPMSVEPMIPTSEPVASPVAPNGKIVLPTMEGLCFEKVKHLNYLEASGNYTALHFIDGRQILVCKTLREVEMMLPEDSFNFRYIDWSGESTGARETPALLDERDWGALVTTPCHFARKFDPVRSARLLDRIDAELLAEGGSPHA